MQFSDLSTNTHTQLRESLAIVSGDALSKRESVAERKAWC
jgi:hypothetical protein